MFDAASDRLQQAADQRFHEMVEAVRAGTVLAHDQKAYSRWRSDVKRSNAPADTKKGLAELIRAAGGVVRDHSELRN